MSVTYVQYVFNEELEAEEVQTVISKKEKFLDPHCIPLEAL